MEKEPRKRKEREQDGPGEEKRSQLLSLYSIVPSCGTPSTA